MILQVLTHAGQRMPHLDAQRCEQVRRADARELQELRRIDRAAADDHLSLRRDLGDGTAASAHGESDADRAFAVEQESCRMGVGFYGEVGARLGRIEKGGGGC